MTWKEWYKVTIRIYFFHYSCLSPCSIQQMFKQMLVHHQSKCSFCLVKWYRYIQGHASDIGVSAYKLVWYLKTQSNVTPVASEVYTEAYLSSVGVYSWASLLHRIFLQLFSLVFAGIYGLSLCQSEFWELDDNVCFCPPSVPCMEATPTPYRK